MRDGVRSAYNRPGDSNRERDQGQVVIDSNTIQHSSQSAILVAPGGVIQNNIIARNGHSGIGGDAATRSSITRNLFFANRGDETRGKNAVTRDPQLVNPTRGDFNLKPTSPAIDAGTKVGLPFKGKAPDIGAFERR